MCWGNAYGNPRIHEMRSLGKEIDQQQWDTLIFKGEHAEKEHWRLVEDRNGQVGYAPTAFLMVILRHDSRGGGKQRYQEGTREQYR